MVTKKKAPVKKKAPAKKKAASEKPTTAVAVEDAEEKKTPARRPRRKSVSAVKQKQPDPMVETPEVLTPEEIEAQVAEQREYGVDVHKAMPFGGGRVTFSISDELAQKLRAVHAWVGEDNDARTLTVVLEAGLQALAQSIAQGDEPQVKAASGSLVDSDLTEDPEFLEALEALVVAC